MNALRKPRVLAVTSSIVVATLLLTGWALWYAHQPIRITYDLANLNVGKPISVSFSHTVQDHLNYNISPSLAGTWRTTRNLFGVTALAFYPSHPLTPGSTYRLTLGHIVPWLAAAPTIAAQTIPVAVERPAAVSAITPSEGAATVPITTKVSLKLSGANRDLRRLILQSDAPLSSADPTSPDDTTFSWHFAQALKQGTTYHLKVIDQKQTDPAKQTLLASTFTTVPEPQITAATNRDHFYPGNTITIGFDQDMAQTAADFQFGMPGSGQWTSARTYQFTPTGLEPGHSYGYTVIAGSKATNGGVTEAAHGYQISTPGAVYVTGFSPSGGNVGLGSAIAVSFDQPVDPASAQAAFQLSPATGGNFSWSGNTMTFHPTSLGYQTGYTITIAPGVKGTYGLPGTQSFSHAFSTTYQIIKLGVPYFHQAYSLSCEEASLRMTLAYRGINVSDFDVLQRVPYNPRPRDQANNVWDNPFQMYVGDINGQMGVTGWGVYSGPIAAAAQSFGRNATAITGITVNQIAQAIHDGNPVVLWGFSGSSLKPDAWNTSSGVVQAPRNEHVRTVYGVAGSAANPLGFYINDPIYGPLYWTTTQLQWNMGFAGTLPSQGVIVY